MKLFKVLRDNSLDIIDVPEIDTSRYIVTETIDISYNKYLDDYDKISRTYNFYNTEYLKDGYIYKYIEPIRFKAYPKDSIVDVELIGNKVLIKNMGSITEMSVQEFLKLYNLYEEEVK